MNKSAEDQAREYAIHHSNAPDKETPDWIITDWLAGYHSRDEEVKKLVEVLRQVERGQYGELKGTFISRITSLAKEALKQYKQ